jgi:phosphoribosylaminoimidazolecarboxamide formyltransferase/IMP cyclohydrolase
MIRVQRALLSVSDKTDLEAFARGLAELGVELLASGGTAEFLRKNGLSVGEISEYTRQPELLGGRVKTLHPKIHAGILARRDDPRHLEELKRQRIELIDLVVVNLYPFEAEVNQETAASEAMEWVDIGGEALIRAAAKHFSSVGVIVDPSDYASVLSELRQRGGLSVKTARAFAQKAFQHVTCYNARIARWFSGDEALPEMLTLTECKHLALRYGENPHQSAALYGAAVPEQLQGKALSFVNILDADAALKCALEFEHPTAVIIKHTSPSGVASDPTLREAFRKAYAADPQSAFGGIIGLNRPLDGPTAELIAQRFFEVVVAPDFSSEALETLRAKENLRLLRAPDEFFDSRREFRTTAFGVLVQTPSQATITEDDLEYTTSKQPTPEQMRDLLFAWKVVKHVKSNAIVLAKDECTTGIGGGQVSRVDATEMAVRKAGHRARGSVLASDAFLPFKDNVMVAAQAGVTAIIQPGGSLRDEEVIVAAEEHGLAMVFTRTREFKH